MKIVHIAPDEKFINSIHWQFEEIFPDQSRYFIFLTVKSDKLKFVNVKKNVAVVRDDEQALRQILNEIKQYDLVISHGLKYFQSRVVLKATPQIKFLWFFWGGEIYDNPKASGLKIIRQKTRKRFVETRFVDRLKSMVKPIYYFLRHQASTPEISILKAAKKIRYIGTMHEEEVLFLKEHSFIDKSTHHIPMTYYPLEFIFKGVENIKLDCQNILLGNSASATNNHLEAFDLIGQFELKERKIIVPLSYGDKAYAEEICETGKGMFPNNFSPIRDFMPLEEYNKILSTCSVVVMNHYRQQAVGNIVAMLWMGAKVYLNEENTFYQFLRRIGVHIYSIEKEFTPQNPFVFIGLNKDQIAANKKILQNEIGFDVLKKNLKIQLAAIANEY